MTAPTRHIFRFRPFELDVLSRRLFRDGELVALTPKAFDLLVLLVERRGQLLDKENLLQTLWPGTYIEESNLSQQVFTIRKVLGEQPNGRPYVETVARRGYVFVAPVEEISESPVNGRPGTAAQRKRVRAAALILGAITLVGIGLGLHGWKNRVSSSAFVPANPAARTLAILPFRALDRHNSDDYFSLGMADAIITRLAQIRGVIVRPTSSVLKYERSEKDPLLIGRELGVESVLDGRFQRSGERIRVSVQLLNVHDGTTIWAEHFDEPLAHVFAVQDAMSERVARALTARLSEQEEKRLTRRYTEDLEAYQLYARGRYLWERRTMDSVRQSIESYEQAIAKDPAYALAYAGLADSYNILGNFGQLPPVEAYSRAKAAASKALELDETLAQAEVAKAFATYLYDREWEEAERGFKAALDKAPNYGPGHQWYAVCLTSRGRFVEAEREIRRALEVDPLSPAINAVLAWIHYLHRDYDISIAASQWSIERDPNFVLAHVYLGMAYLGQQQYEEAITALRHANRLHGATFSDRAVGYLGMALARSGRTAEARDLQEQLRSRSKSQYVSAYGEALIRLGLGEHAGALTLLEQTLNEHYPWVIHYNVEPVLDPLRGEARFKALLRRIGIPEIDPDTIVTPESQ